MIGMAVAVLRRDGCLPVRMLYLYLTRGTPLAVMVFAAYYVLLFASIHVSPALAGALVSLLYFGANMSEVFRAALEFMPRGQWDSGRALGMRGSRLMPIVVVPPALRLADRRSSIPLSCWSKAHRRSR
jgi:polar amino acid transport system permease protein